MTDHDNNVPRSDERPTRITTILRPEPSTANVTRVSTSAHVNIDGLDLLTSVDCYTWDGHTSGNPHTQPNAFTGLSSDLKKAAEHLEQHGRDIFDRWQRTNISEQPPGHHPQRLIVIDRIDCQPGSLPPSIAATVAARCLYDAGAWVSDVLITSPVRTDDTPWRNEILNLLGLTHSGDMWFGNTFDRRPGDVIVDLAR